MTNHTLHSTATDVSVVVLNWNGFDDTRQCIKSLLHQDFEGFDIVLVDNHSQPEERNKLKEAYGHLEPQLRLVFNDDNLGFARAHNRVFRMLSREGKSWVACLNNDAVAEPQWLSAMLQRAEREGCPMVASRMVAASVPGRLDNVGHFMLNTGEIVPKGHGDPADRYAVAGKTLGPCAGACLYRLQLLMDLDGFDEHFFVGYEDAELGLRAWLVGHDCFYEPQAVVYHKVSASLNKVRSAAYLASIQAHIFYTWFKLMPFSTLAVNAPWFAVKYGAVLLIDIALLRFRFLFVMCSGIVRALRNRGRILAARKAFYERYKIVRTRQEVSRELIFFLWFDVQRFWKFVILRRKSNLEV